MTATELEVAEGAEGQRALPQPTASLFIAAGSIVAERAARERAGHAEVEAILRHAVEQATRVLRTEVA